MLRGVYDTLPVPPSHAADLALGGLVALARAVYPEPWTLPVPVPALSAAPASAPAPVPPPAPALLPAPAPDPEPDPESDEYDWGLDDAPDPDPEPEAEAEPDVPAPAAVRYSAEEQRARSEAVRAIQRRVEAQQRPAPADPSAAPRVPVTVPVLDAEAPSLTPDRCAEQALLTLGYVDARVAARCGLTGAAWTAKADELIAAAAAEYDRHGDLVPTAALQQLRAAALLGEPHTAETLAPLLRPWPACLVQDLLVALVERGLVFTRAGLYQRRVDAAELYAQTPAPLWACLSRGQGS